MTLKSLSKPTLFQTISGGIITVFRDSFRLSRPSLPKQIGKYTLVKDVSKERGYSYSFSLGVYTHEGKQYFIKHWQGTIKDLNYYNLINEYLIGNFMEKRLAQTQQITIRAPKIIEYIQTPHSFSIVYEYIEGKSLSLYPEPLKSKVLIDALDVLHDISQSLTSEEKKIFSQRTRRFYQLSFFPLYLYVVCMNIRSAGIVTKSFIKALQYFSAMKKIPYGIAHRDLDATNIVIGKDHAYLTDFETMTWTLASYDTIRLTLMPDLKKFPEDIAVFVKKPENIFVRTYILFHLLLSANTLPEVKKEYLEKLISYE